MTVTITINLEVDDTGRLLGPGTMYETVAAGEVTIKGETYGVGTTLLAGSVYSFGWGEAASELGIFDFLLDNITGALVTDGVWPDNNLTGIFVLAEDLVGWGGSWVADFDLAKVKGNKAPVPEPTTICLLGLGGLLLRRKRDT